MRVDYVCPACEDTIEAPPSLEGSSADCPKCKATIKRWPAPRWKSSPKPLSLDDKFSPSPVEEIADLQGKDPAPRRETNTFLKHASGLPLTLAVAAAIFGGMILYRHSGEMKSIDGTWEEFDKELAARRKAQYWGGFLLFGGIVVACGIYVENFKNSVWGLNPFPGRLETDVLAKLGEGSGLVVMPDGATRRHWRTLWYALVLDFRDGRCVGVVAEET